MPLTDWLARSMPRWLAAALSLLTFFVAVGVVVSFIGLQTASQWEGITNAFSQGVTDLQTWLREGPLQVTDAQLTEIAEMKMADLNANDIDMAKRIIAGTARSMGITTD